MQFLLENKDSRLDAYEIIYGIELNGKFKAYNKSDLEQKLKIEDTIGGEGIIIEFDKGLKSAKHIRSLESRLSLILYFGLHGLHSIPRLNFTMQNEENNNGNLNGI